jgi:hypothetical protein
MPRWDTPGNGRPGAQAAARGLRATCNEQKGTDGTCDRPATGMLGSVGFAHTGTPICLCVKVEDLTVWSALLVWPEVGCSEDEIIKQPDFPDDNWATWRARFEGHESMQRLRDLGCGSIFALTADGMPPEEESWTSPEELLAAVERLEAILRADPVLAAAILEEYEDYVERGVPLLEQFINDLAILGAKARYAVALGRERVTIDLEC